MKQTLAALLCAILPLVSYGQKITDFPAATDAADADVIPIVDVSDVSVAPTGRTEKVSITTLKTIFQPYHASLLALATDGFTGTGAFVRAGSPTFTGTAVFDVMTVTTLNAISLSLSNGADPTTDAAGEIAIDTDDLFLEFFDGTASRVVGAVQTASVTIYDPDGIQAVSDALPVLAVEATWAPQGITVRDIYLKTDASSTYSIDLEEWTAMLSPTVTSIEVVATSASAEAEDDGTLADASVSAGSIIFVDLPATTANFITVSFTYVINPGN